MLIVAILLAVGPPVRSQNLQKIAISFATRGARRGRCS
jgi:hypothetical protein